MAAAPTGDRLHYTGTVTAADNWDVPADRKVVRPAGQRGRAVPSGRRQFLLWFGLTPPATAALRSARLERALGVIYQPQTERESHYFRARGRPGRCRDPYRRDTCARTARTYRPMETGRGPGDLSLRRRRTFRSATPSIHLHRAARMSPVCALHEASSAPSVWSPYEAVIDSAADA
ncbi:erythromycin esterase family protein [Actinoallomurus rhizosphaericola]|uniref:erythromycin esterase family protein n=1 Tax=Actinoallomurus rhizosphaericola TaxID=2952536 RepID=UPI003872DFF8